MNWIEAITNRISSFIIGKPPFIMAIIPRSADRIFTSKIFSNTTTDTAIQADQIRDRLPRWRQPHDLFIDFDKNKRIKDVEYRMYIDFATEIGGSWLSKKKFSIVCFYCRPKDTYRPVTNLSISLARVAGSTDTQFSLQNGTLVNELKDQNRPVTNSQGIAEFTLVHPTKTLSDANRTVRIEAVALIPLLGNNGQVSSHEPVTARQSIAVLLTRNSAATDLPTIYNEPTDQNSSLDLWCYQPAAAEPINDGIRQLQEVLNEVVSRHRGISHGANGDNFKFLSLDGIYSKDTKHIIGKYLQRFPNISTTDYPYNLSRVGPENVPIGPDPAFLTAIKEDYAPFDPTLDANRGWIVDRRLLIGAQYDIAPNHIDGLIELYEGVVQVLKTQMREYGQSYLDCDMFWLHRPEHGPYSPATDKVFGCKNNNIILLTIASNTAAPLVSNGSNVVINDGEHFLVSSESGNWVSIRHSAGIGWVQKNNGVIVLNDRGAFRAIGKQIRNHGIFGIAGVGYAQSHTANGVAYTYGGKQTPDEWRNSLLANTHASPAQIVNYSEYDAGCMFGEIKSEYDAGDMTHKMAGCDCSGFVQNCIIHSFFPGTTTMIVPTAIISSAWLGSSQFIGNNLRARPVPRPLNDQNQHWIRGADIIQHPGHIVMVAEDNPTMLNDAVDFKIMQECGGAKASDTSQFRRKSVRSPFTWWSATHAGFNFGKVFIWR